MKVLITGGAGFIGSNLLRFLLRERPDWHITNLDLLTYAGNLGSIDDLLDHPRHRFVRADVADREAVDAATAGHYDLIMNLAAESHVDRSILGAADFVRTNIMGTQVLLDAARENGWGRFLQVSTDEVYGSLGPLGSFTERTPLSPRSPYAASKASADLLVSAAHDTHGQDVVITRCSNNYGPHQFPEKLIPVMILAAVRDRPLPVYGEGRNVRDWIHVEDHCRALLTVAELGTTGRVYNIGARNERQNLDLVRAILSHLGKPETLITFVKDRPGHDFRYAIDSSRIEEELHWTPRHEFALGLGRTIDWYLAHPDWCDSVRSGEYLEFHDRWYADRIPPDPEPNG